MGPSLVTAPATEPVTVKEAKAEVKLGDDVTDQNDRFAAWISARRGMVEQYTRRGLITQTWDQKLDWGFPCDGAPIVIPRAPVASVTSITYVDTAGVTQTWGTANYTVDMPSGPTAQLAQIWPAYQVVYPVTRRVPNAVTVRYVCGYGATAESVPAELRVAIKKFVAMDWMGCSSPEDVQCVLNSIFGFKAF